MIKPEKYFCDICGKEIIKTKLKRPVYVIADCNWTDGMPEAPHVERETLDLCDDCLLKSTNIHCDFQGSNPRFIGLTYKNGNKLDQLFEKDTPLKPIEDENDVDNWKCPRCGEQYSHICDNFIDIGDYLYCPRCGQKLDWGE